MTLFLWRELGENMRKVRVAAGASLRDVEARCGRSRGTLSQVENGKARPSVELVRWYDENFAADGLLLSGYADARAAGAVVAGRAAPGDSAAAGDAMTLVSASPAFGAAAPADTAVELRWVLRNTGSVPWAGRALRRLGAVGGLRLLTTVSSTPLPDVAPGNQAEVVVTAQTPPIRSTVAAYWQLVDASGTPCFPGDPLIAAQLVIV